MMMILLLNGFNAILELRIGLLPTVRVLHLRVVRRHAIAILILRGGGWLLRFDSQTTCTRSPALDSKTGYRGPHNATEWCLRRPVKIHIIDRSQY